MTAFNVSKAFHKHTTIQAGTMRDLSYVASRLRQADRAEIDCQLPGWSPLFLAAVHLQGLAWTASWKGNPEMAFGCGEQRQGLWTAWSWGSEECWRCSPSVVDFIKTVSMPSILETDATRVEARALDGNLFAEKFLWYLGATRRCELPGYGVNGETFVLYDWTRETAP
jgi:hypothetical protein